MDFLSCVKERRSVRIYQSVPVERKVLVRIIETASYAPSWKNSQVVRYVAVSDKVLKDTIARECVKNFPHNQPIIENAPTLLVQSVIKGRCGYERDGSPSTIKGDGWEMFDAGISAQTVCLTAHNEGLGTVIMGIFDEDRVATLINLPTEQRVTALITIGHPAERPAMPKRKSIEDLFSYAISQ